MSRKLLALIASLLFAAGSVQAADTKADCEKQAAEKKLAGAAKTSFVKKCSGEGAGSPTDTCEKQAAEKKLAGAAKNSFVKKCVADASAASAPTK
jgi:hypothetical protein